MNNFQGFRCVQHTYFDMSIPCPDCIKQKRARQTVAFDDKIKVIAQSNNIVHKNYKYYLENKLTYQEALQLMVIGLDNYSKNLEVLAKKYAALADEKLKPVEPGSVQHVPPEKYSWLDRCIFWFFRKLSGDL